MKHTLKSNYKDIIKTTISIEVDKNTDAQTQKEILLDFAPVYFISLYGYCMAYFYLCQSARRW